MGRAREALSPYRRERTRVCNCRERSRERVGWERLEVALPFLLERASPETRLKASVHGGLKCYSERRPVTQEALNIGGSGIEYVLGTGNGPIERQLSRSLRSGGPGEGTDGVRRRSRKEGCHA